MKRIYTGRTRENGVKAMKEAKKKAIEEKVNYPNQNVTFGTISNFSKGNFQAVVEVE